MTPGLTRAVPASILGFLGGALLVILIRGLQGVDPLWDAGIGIIMATFTTAAAFVWGMGGFNPAMNTHPHAPEVDQETGLIIAEAHDEEHEEEEEPTPMQVLGYSIWQITFWVIALLVLLAAAALFSGFFLQTSSDPAASTDAVGYTDFQLPFGGPEVQLSQLTLLMVVLFFTVASLAAIGGVVALVFFGLSRGVTEAKATEGVPLGADLKALPATTSEEAEAEEEQEEVVVEEAPTGNPLVRRGIAVATFVVTFVVLYLLFYYVLIGLILPDPVLLSLVNALLFTFLILHPRPLLRTVGRISGWLANVLRRAPAVLFQR